MSTKQELFKEHTDLLFNMEKLEIIAPDDPDLMRMEEIMRELKELQEDE